MYFTISEIVRREKHIEHNRWTFPEIDPSYHPKDLAQYIFTNVDDLAQYTRVKGEFHEGIVQVAILATEDEYGCTLYGKRQFGFPAATIFFAYSELSPSKPLLILARPPRIQVDENGISYYSGHSTHLLSHRPLPKE